MAEYTLGSGVEAKQRLSIQARAFRRTTVALLERVGLQQGYRCLDVGCGSGDVTLDIARLVGPLGKAVGIDVDDVVLRLAREDATAQAVENAEFRTQSVENLDEMGYDLVYTRMLLVHLGDPARALQAMVRAVKPGGVIVVEDAEGSAEFCYPPNVAFDLFTRWACETMRRAGGNPDIGPRLPAYLRASGLSAVAMSLAQVPLYLKEDKVFFDLTMQQLRPATLAKGVARQEEFDKVHATLRAFVDDPGSVLALPRLWQVWGYKS